MPAFLYSAVDRAGKTVKGERDAEDEKALAVALKAEGLYLLEAKKRGSGGLAALNVNLNEILAKIRPIRLVDKMFFSRNLAVMIVAGLSLTRALDALTKETPHPRFKKIIEEISGSVVKGKSFADSLRAREEIFGDLFINMVEVGETAGKLTLVLRLLSNQMKRDYDLRRRIVGAMMYPAIIITALIGIAILMMIYVVPSLSQTIRELGVELPLTTQLVLAVSDFMANYTILLLAGLVFMVIIFWRLLRTKIGRELFDRLVIRLPIFGSLVKKFNTARFCRTLAYLITSGVPIVRSLEITSSVLGNTLYRVAVRSAAAEIQKGKQLHEILQMYPAIFQPLVVQMIAVGEETGKISSMMLRLALFFEEDVTATTKNLSTIIEPILMIIIGAAVGFFAVSMLQPIYSSLGNL